MLIILNKGIAIVHIDQYTDGAQRTFSDKLAYTDSWFSMSLSINTRFR